MKLGRCSPPLVELSLLANSVCLLSREEAARLEIYSIWPTCKSHRHCTRREALDGVATDELRWVGGSDTKVAGPVSMVVPVSQVNGWQPVPCHDEHGRLVMGFRVWGNTPRS